MKRIVLLLSALVLSAFAANAQNIMAENVSLEYKVTEILSLGNSYSSAIGSGNKIHKISNGKVGDVLSVNTKTNILKIADNRIKYSVSSRKADKFPETDLIKGDGTMDGGAVKFQIIDSFSEGKINIVVSWPDNSSARIIAKLEKRMDL